jgi:hypothetical protein
MRHVLFALTLQDYVAFHQYHAQTQSKRALWVLFAVFVMGALFLFFTNPRPGNEWNWPFAMALIVILSFLALVIRFNHLATGLIVREQLKKGKDAEKMFSEQEMVVSEEAITHSSALGVAKTPWTSVEKIVATPRHLFIYLTTSSALIVPSRACTNDEEFRESVETVREYHRPNSRAPDDRITRLPKSQGIQRL